MPSGDVTATLKPIDGKIALHVFQDRGSIEVFANGGAVALCAKAIPADGQQSVGVFGGNGPIIGLKGDVFELNSAWKK
jgi:sucrose-6-phosphate hydrolase SacC (GH32 family)